MGISELAGVFACAGARFSDLTEFRDEQADWELLDRKPDGQPSGRPGLGEHRRELIGQTRVRESSVSS